MTLAVLACSGGPERIVSSDPEFDDRLDSLGIVCQSTLTVTGTFTEARPQPGDISGCWEVGRWDVDWAIDTLGCSPQPDFPSVFSYEASRSADNDPSVVWLDDPEFERVRLSIPGDGGECHGNFEHYGIDGDNRTVIELKPVLQADGSQLGIGSW